MLYQSSGFKMGRIAPISITIFLAVADLVGCVAGINNSRVIAGTTIPDSWSLSFAIPLTFIAVVAPSIHRRADLVACVVAATLSLICQPLPWKSWIMVAACGGVAAGWLTHYQTQKQDRITADNDRGCHDLAGDDL